MNGSDFHNLAQWLGMIVTVGSLWRFVIKPLFDERETVRKWRRDINARMALLEQDQPDKVAALRHRLTEGD